MFQHIFEKLLNSIVKRGKLDVTFFDGRHVTAGAPEPGFPEVAIRMTDAKVPRDIMGDIRLGTAEAYMAGRIVIERGGIMELVQLIRANRPWERAGSLPKPGAVKRVKNALSHSVNSFNRASRSKQNVAHHYDIGDDLYRLMLDHEHMQYSCAYWPQADMSLGEAQHAKLAHIAAKLALSPGQKVLDIGCGWGGMAIFLARHARVVVHGITLSEDQLAIARKRAQEAGIADRVTFELVDYRDLAKRGDRFERIVSVGMFEHVGQPQFNTFFNACANLLTDDGVMLMHTIGRMGGPGKTDAFTSKYIFPGGYIPALSETLAASEKSRLIATDVETLRLHYAYTLREWYLRCLEHRDDIIAMFDEGFFRMWTMYLAGATAAFESGGMCNYQIQFARSRHTLPLTRDYITKAETALTAS
ncbi:MAG: cyclopropane-fatty-acyl-phospholipid synthase family protein [Sphingomonadaceae bacterium]|nr:cyclopropane-fatty-acyl-phospholipid synthase family protein [Sphingomonadaceae bacterium]